MANYSLQSLGQLDHMSAEAASSQFILDTYLHRLVTRLQEELEGNLLAVYLFGSAGYGAYEPGTSDVDVYAIVHAPIPDYHKLSRTIGHAALPCPARKLEFVLFTKDNAAKQTASPVFEMNFNTGKDMDDYLNLTARTEPRFWFLLDIAIGRELGKSLIGPPPSTTFAAPRLDFIFDCMIESLAWQRENDPITSDGVLNACRELSYAKTSTWRSKINAGAWVLENYNRPEVVGLAMDARVSKAELPQNLALDFLLLVEKELKEWHGN